MTLEQLQIKTCFSLFKYEFNKDKKILINGRFTIFRSLLVTRGIRVRRATKMHKLIRQLKYRYIPLVVNTVITCKHERMINSGNFQIFPRVC